MKQLLCLVLSFLPSALSAQWAPLGGPNGGSANDFAGVDGKIYAAVGKVCYASTDGAKHWNPVTNFPFYTQNIGVGHEGVLYATEALQQNIWPLVWPSSLWRQNTPSDIWEMVFDTADMESATEQIISIKAHHQTVIVSTDYNIYYSFDKGNNWSKSEGGLIAGTTKIIYATDSVWFAMGDRRIHRSMDDGATWLPIFQNVHGLQDITWSGTHVYGFYKNVNLLVKSSDFGNSWEYIEVPGLYIYPYDKINLTSQKDSILLTTSGGCIEGGINNYLSYDRGVTWQHFLNDSSFSDGVSRLQTFSETIIGDLSGQGIITSNYSSGKLEVSYDGIHAARVSQIFVFQDIFWVNTISGIWCSRDQGQSWNMSLPRNESCFSQPDVIIVANQLFTLHSDEEILWRYDSIQDQWIHIPYPISSVGVNLVGNSTHLFMERSNAILVSGDLGLNWTKITNIPTAFNNFAATDSLWIVRKSVGGYWSTDQGITWNNYTKDPRPPGSISFITLQGIMIFRRSPQLICHWLIQNDTFEYFYPIFIPNGDTLEIPRFLTVDESGVLWAAHTSYGLLFSTDLGRNWQPFHAPLEEDRPYHFYIDDQYMIAATAQGLQIYQSTEVEKWPENKSLTLQFYPNPNNGAAKLTCSEYIGTKLHFSVFDATGRLLDTQTLPPGQQWDIEVSFLPAGAYFGSLTPLNSTDRSQHAFVKWIKM